MNIFNINRRKFLKNSSTLLAMSQLGPYGLDLINPAKIYKVGLIGTGWYGKSDLFRLMQVVPVEVVSLCDPDKNQLNEAADMMAKKQPKRPNLYGDYRKMLSENQLDIVIVGSPDHWHALHMIDSVKSGAHVYVQKPISVDVVEGEAMVAAARKYNKVVQVGMQRRSTPHLLEAKKNIIDAGLLGKVKHVEMCCYYPMRNPWNPPLAPVPDFFDYEMWTGPAPLRPFDGLPHTRGWRAFMEYGNGITGDMCVHMFDAVRFVLGLGWPKKISSVGGVYVQTEGKSNISDTQHATFEYDDLSCVWQHRSWGTAPDKDYPWSFTLYGDKGTLRFSTMMYDFTPIGKDAKPIHGDVVFEKEKYPDDLKEPRIELNAAPATRAQMLDFVAAIENKTLPVADIEQGHISAASCILANMSMKLGRPLAYDPIKKIVTNDPEATKLLARKYRSPWVHPTLKNI
jgi:predicted dehydrogenase